MEWDSSPWYARIHAGLHDHKEIQEDVSQWRMEWDSNPRYTRMHAGFQDRFLKPLGHPSTYFYIKKFNVFQELFYVRG